MELDKAVVRAGVNGTLEQFTLRKGDIVNPLMRPAGILVPTEAGRKAMQAGFSQIEAQVIKNGNACRNHLRRKALDHHSNGDH